MREERMEGIASVRRDRTVEENLRVFGEMAKASEEVYITRLVDSHYG
jgi:glutamyl-tRNA synthetase